MWDAIEGDEPVLLSSDEFRTFLSASKFGNDAHQAASSAAMLLRSGYHAEAFVGGDDSKSMLQLLGATTTSSSEGEGDNLDVVCSLLIPTDPVQCVGTARGVDALQLLGCFWERHPSAPLLVPQGERHVHVTCSLAEKEWTMAPLSAKQLGRLRSMAAATDDDDDSSSRVVVQVPVPPPSSSSVA